MRVEKKTPKINKLEHFARPLWKHVAGGLSKGVRGCVDCSVVRANRVVSLPTSVVEIGENYRSLSSPAGGL